MKENWCVFVFVLFWSKVVYECPIPRVGLCDFVPCDFESAVLLASVFQSRDSWSCLPCYHCSPLCPLVTGRLLLLSICCHAFIRWPTCLHAFSSQALYHILKILTGVGKEEKKNKPAPRSLKSIHSNSTQHMNCTACGEDEQQLLRGGELCRPQRLGRIYIQYALFIFCTLDRDIHTYNQDRMVRTWGHWRWYHQCFW